MSIHAHRVHGGWHLRAGACLERQVTVLALSGKAKLLLGNIAGILEFSSAYQRKNFVECYQVIEHFSAQSLSSWRRQSSELAIIFRMDCTGSKMADQAQQA